MNSPAGIPARNPWSKRKIGPIAESGALLAQQTSRDTRGAGFGEVILGKPNMQTDETEMNSRSIQKVVHISQSGGIGGVSRVISLLAAEQVAAGLEVKVAMTSFWDSAPFREWFGCEGTLFFDDCVGRYSKPYIGQFRRLVRWLRDEKPDVLHIHSGSNIINPRFVLAGRLAGIRKIVVIVHHLAPYSGVSKLKIALTKFSASMAGGVVASSELMAEGLKGVGIKPSKIDVVYEPVGVAAAPSSAPVESLRATLGLPPDAFLIGNVARFDRQGDWDKGQLNLVKAVELAALQQPNLHVAFVGTGPEQETVREYAEAHCPGRVSFLGNVSELSDFYQSIDLFAHLSSQEGFGLVFIEAAKCEVPAIGTNVGGIPFAIEDGVTGRLVEYGDIEGTSRLLIELMEDRGKLKGMGQAAKERANKLFDPALVSQQYLRIYERR